MQGKPKVLIVEDEPLIAENIAMHLNDTAFEVSGIAYDYEEALQLLKKGMPDIAILDINLEEEHDGIEIAEHIKRTSNIPFLFLTSYSDKATIDRVKKTGPYAYLVKPFNKNTLLASLEIALSNFNYEHNQHIPFLNLFKINKQIDPANLSQREFEVIQAIYAGKSNQDICSELFISLNTLKRHINNAYMKLAVPNRSAAIAQLRTIMQKQ